MTEFNNIFVVFDPTREKQPALERAIDIAGHNSAKLHVYACIHADIPKSADKQAEVKRSLAEQKEILDKMVAPIIDQGMNVVTEVEWDKDWAQTVVRAAIRNHADVVFKSFYKHSAGKRILNRSGDWTLIRESLCPVLLVKDTEPREVRRVLAAIDIRTGKESYAKLNRNIIDFSKRILDKKRAEVHFINAFEDFKAVPDRNALIRNCGIESDKIHIKMGNPEKVIVDSAKKLDASLVVVGNSARSGFSAAVHGNTVEKILDKLECDVLSMP